MCIISNPLPLSPAQDLPTAAKSRAVKLKLEKELNTLRATRSAALQDTTGGAGKSVQLQDDFTFEKLPRPVVFVDTSCKGANPNLEELKAWITLLEGGG